MPDYERLRLEVLAGISETAHGLAEEQWDAESLCEGWRVRDVVSHMCLGYKTPFPAMILKVGRRGFNVPRASLEESISFGSDHSPAEILLVFDGIWTQNTRKGISRVIPQKEGLVDHVIHHQDIRRPLGLGLDLPEKPLVAALDVVPTLGGFVGAKARVSGLRLVADDVGWSAGSGPEVRGAGEAILLAASGRGIVLDELTGDGVETLRTRIAA